MKVHYTGKTNTMSPDQQRKIDSRFAKLARVLDMKQGEREAHVILKPERHMRHAEITVRFHDHNLVGVGTGSDDYLAMHEALERLEKQIHKLKSKWRDAKRAPREEWAEVEAAAEEEDLQGEAEISQKARALGWQEGRPGPEPQF